MNGLKKKLVTGAIVATVAALSCSAAFAMGGGPGGPGGGMGGGQMGGGMGGQMGGGMQTTQQGGQSGGQQGGFDQMGFTQGTQNQQTQTVDTMSSATVSTNTQNTRQTPTQGTQSNQQGQMPTQGQQNGQQGQMPGNGQMGGRQGGLLEALAEAVGVTTSDTTDTDKSADADTLVASIKAAVEALDSDDLAALAKTCNIDTTDKTDAEILAAVEKLLEKPSDNGQGQNGQQNGQAPGKGGFLDTMAADVSVTVTENEKPDEIAAAIKTAVEALDSDARKTLAEKYDIDTTDKTDDEILAALEALLTPPTTRK